MKSNSTTQTTQEAIEALVLTLLYLPLVLTELDFLIPENSSLGRRLKRSLDEDGEI